MTIPRNDVCLDMDIFGDRVAPRGDSPSLSESRVGLHQRREVR